MSAYNEYKLKQIKTNMEETKHFLDDLVDEYESKTKFLAEIVSKPESARVEELKEQLHQVQTKNAALTNKYVEWASPKEIEQMFEAYYIHIDNTCTTLYHKPRWTVVHNELGVYRVLECECGEILYNGSVY